MVKLIVTLTGPSYSGKSTVERALSVHHGFSKVISTTTRSPRAGEAHGVDYYFKSKEEFAAIQRDFPGTFIESTEFRGELYGIHSTELDRISRTGAQTVVVVAEPNGVSQIRKWCEAKGLECVSFYLDTPLHVCFQRMVQRFSNENAEAEAPKYLKRVANLELEFKWKEEWREQCSWDVVPNDRDSITYILQTLAIRTALSEGRYEAAFPPLPILPSYDFAINGEPCAYSRKRLQDFASHVAHIMITHAVDHMLPTKDMRNFPPPKMMSESETSMDTEPRWSSDPHIHNECVSKILEIAGIKDTAKRHDAALGWIEYCSAYPNLAGDKPINYFAVLSAYARDPKLLKQES